MLKLYQALKSRLIYFKICWTEIWYYDVIPKAAFSLVPLKILSLAKVTFLFKEHICTNSSNY